jgi:hypothetical protein
MIFLLTLLLTPLVVKWMGPGFQYGFWKLIINGQVKSLLIYTLLFMVSLLNRVLIPIEDYLFPSLARMQRDYFESPGKKVVFILGH